MKGVRRPRRQVRSLDAKNAYLQGEKIERDLFMQLPAGGIPGVPAGSVLKANVPIYGTGDACRGWWLTLRKSALECEWVESVLEPALFYL